MTDETPTVDEVREALERIAKDDTDGLIEAEAVVEAASDPESPLHRYFTWDDNEAAHQYRLVQARHLIARVTVTRVQPAPQYVNVRIGQRRGYVSTERAVADPDLYAQVAREARRGIISYRNRLAAFEQAAKVVAALDVATDSLEPPAPEARQ